MAVSVYTGAGAGVASFNGRTGKVVPADGDYTKAQVGLGNVDNTSDESKPISTATQTALNTKAAKKKQVTLVLQAGGWTDASSGGLVVYEQPITESIVGGTIKTIVDLQPGYDMVYKLSADKVMYLYVANTDGEFKAIALGGKPSITLSVQATYQDIA